jgi:hypothetical protein
MHCPACVCRYNYLLYVPYQLERVMTFGTCLCCWSYLVRAAQERVLLGGQGDGLL